MRLRKISDRQNFCYCKVKSLIDIDMKRSHIKAGDIIYAMLFPGGRWTLFNSNDETGRVQCELLTNAIEGKDFEDIKERTTNTENN